MNDLKSQNPTRKVNIFRRPSTNTSIESSDSSPMVKKKYIMERSLNTSKQETQPNLNINFGTTRKLKICDGEKLSYEVIKKDSRQKRSEFLDKYANDPFMRKKFEKSVQKFNRSKSRQLIEDKKVPSVGNETSRRIVSSQTFTTFREQIKEQSKKTANLIVNCRQLVEELKRNRQSGKTREQHIEQKRKKRQDN